MVRSSMLVDIILSITKFVKSEVAQKVRTRIITVDLVAANARYHKVCYQKHFMNQKVNLENKNKDPKEQEPSEIDMQMDKIYSYVNQSDAQQFVYKEFFDHIDKVCIFFLM